MSADAIGVIGAGGAGLAAMKALAARGIPFVGYEAGSDVGGTWRYENDGGPSAAYASLRTNVSRRRMQYRDLPIPRAFGDYPHHTRMAAYLAAYAWLFDLCRHIRFTSRVERLEPDGRGGWRLDLRGGETARHRAVIIANGHHWDPRWPDLPGTTTAAVTHAQTYRTPAPFAGRRVLVIGAGQSAVEIALEVSRVAARTIMSVRSGAHVLPRWVFGRPLDWLDGDAVNRLPWVALNALVAALVRMSRREGPAAHAFPVPSHRLLEEVPVVSSDLAAALRSGAVAIRTGVTALDGATVVFGDGSSEAVDAIVCATGYRLSLPFLSPALLAPQGTALPLYRRIVPLDVRGIYFIGLVDAPSGLLPIVERQAAWLVDVLEGRIVLPDRSRMQAAVDAGERRSRARFPGQPPYTIRCDPHAYVRLLARDRRRARLRALLGLPGPGHLLWHHPGWRRSRPWSASAPSPGGRSRCADGSRAAGRAASSTSSRSATAPAPSSA
jgi:cation diffusion facilitator CzcD-associated flavoprotein CzcO